MRAGLIAAVVVMFGAGVALAHAAEQGFVLLLPTDIYITAGVASVALTIVLIALLPAPMAKRIFASLPVLPRGPALLRHGLSLLATGLLAFAVWRGFTGPRDPLSNPLPLMIWTVWWVGLVTAQGLIGNHWRYSNPWTGLAFALHRITGTRAPLRYPRWLGHWPAVVSFIGFAAFLLADPAPADPARLAAFAGLYWYAAFFGLILFGPAWMVRAEAFTVMMRAYGRMGLFGPRGRRIGFGLWGWQGARGRLQPLSLSVFVLILLGTGSFDGLNETFFWLDLLGINPLEFPGRSAVIWQNLTGLIAANAALIAAFAACLWLGEKLAGSGRSLRDAFCLYAPSILPIAIAYHVAHYLTSFLVDGQYVALMLNDPMARGADVLGLGEYYVTTGFFNTPGTVKAIWLTQAGAVVVGHVVAILLAHALAMRDQSSTRRAILGQAPLAAFMVAYTFFGLWLLASPRGL
ncbi:MAG: hypothetical protein AAFY25_08315 [Pseudomonadota bacterium]